MAQKVKTAIFSNRSFSRLDIVLLGIIAVFSFLLRIFNAKNGLPYMHYWDEPEIAFNALDMLLTGDMNPHFFNYGSLLIYLNLGVDWLYIICLKLFSNTPFSVSNLNYGAMSGYDWFLSLPSFLFWNRALTALLGTLTIAVVYYLSLKLGNRFAALAASIFLGSTQFHIQHAAFVTTDVPMTFFVVVVFFFVYQYLEKQKTSYFVLALIFSGFATSVKYNAGLIVLVPAIALALCEKDEHYRKWLWLGIPVLPVLAFVLSSPYALLDFPNFFDAVKYELLHYSVQGHGGASIEPGLAHMLYQGRLFLTNFGVIGLAFALLGIAKLYNKKIGWLLLGYQSIYFLFMTQMKVSFHRNFLLMYPFVAILFGLGIAFLYESFLSKTRIKPYFNIIFGLLVSAFLLARVVQASRESWGVWITPETRTQAISVVNNFLLQSDDLSVDFPLVGVAAELRIHPQDLDALQAHYVVLPYLELLQYAEQYDMLIGFGEAKGSNATQREMANQLNAAIDKIPEGAQIHVGSVPLYVQIFSINPDVVIINEPEKLQNLIFPMQ